MAEYRIDDLAHAAGSTVRNIRAYQDRGCCRRPGWRAGSASTTTPTSPGSG
ncbi:MerR family transcriptional regulator [Actinomadura yumaensis]|uniref:MerR family transcriptional regulator n=1 Tax=Actinomadura yumaensis TaxID=111807 RepID=UPI00361A3001